MKKIFLAILLLNSSFGLFAQKTAFLNETKLLESIPGYTLAIKEGDSIKRVFTADISEKNKNFSAKLQNFLKPYNVPNNATLEEVTSKLSEKDKGKMELLKEEGQLLDKQIKSIEAEYNDIINSKVSKYFAKANEVVKNYCKQNKIEVLLKIDVLASAIAYLDESKDITSELINKLK